MCQKLEVLTCNAHGYVAVCHSCNAITIAFGTLLTALEQPDVEHLLEDLNESVQTYRHQVCHKAKAFVFPAGYEGTSRMVLTYREMEILSDMLSQALLLQQAITIINEGDN